MRNTHKAGHQARLYVAKKAAGLINGTKGRANGR